MICFSCVWIFSSVYIYIAIFPQMYSRQSFFLLSISLFTVRMTFLLCKSFEFHDVLFFSSLFLELLESFSKCHFLWRYHKVFPYSHQKVTFYDALEGVLMFPPESHSMTLSWGVSHVSDSNSKAACLESRPLISLGWFLFAEKQESISDLLSVQLQFLNHHISSRQSFRWGLLWEP